MPPDTARRVFVLRCAPPPKIVARARRRDSTKRLRKALAALTPPRIVWTDRKGGEDE